MFRPAATPAEAFARIIAVLCQAVAARGGRGGLAGPLVILIWSRLSRFGTRFARLNARLNARLAAGLAAGVAAGRPARRRRRAPTPRPARPAPSLPAHLLPPILPRGFAWLIRLVPTTGGGASQLRYLLATPEMTELLAAAPQAGRILRPLCHMLGVRLPPGLRRQPPAATPAEPRPEAATPGAPAPAAAPCPPPTAAPPPLLASTPLAPTPRRPLLHACGPPAKA